MSFKNGIKILSLLLILTSCQGPLFEKEVSLVLGVEKADAENVYYTDRFAGNRKGYTFEVYKLSNNTVREFENKSIKTLPDRKNHIWQKQDWNNTKPDISYDDVFEKALNYNDGDKDLEKK